MSTSDKAIQNSSKKKVSEFDAFFMGIKFGRVLLDVECLE